VLNETGDHDAHAVRPRVARSGSLAQECGSQEIQARISFWRGVELHRRDGTPIKLGSFGGGYELVFQGSERALASMRTYRNLRIIGTATRLTGLAAW